MQKQSIRRSNPGKPISPKRGEIWWVRFNDPPSAPTPPDGTPKEQFPTTGDEIQKQRPAVVLNIAGNWMRKLHIVVPLTSWKAHYKKNQYFWMLAIPKDNSNMLKRDSAADISQI